MQIQVVSAYPGTSNLLKRASKVKGPNEGIMNSRGINLLPWIYWFATGNIEEKGQGLHQPKYGVINFWLAHGSLSVKKTPSASNGLIGADQKKRSAAIWNHSPKTFCIYFHFGAIWSVRINQRRGDLRVKIDRARSRLQRKAKRGVRWDIKLKVLTGIKFPLGKPRSHANAANFWKIKN